MLYRCHSVIVKENDKTKSVHVQCGDHFFSEYFQFMLVESMDVVPINTEGQQHALFTGHTKHPLNVIYFKNSITEWTATNFILWIKQLQEIKELWYPNDLCTCSIGGVWRVYFFWFLVVLQFELRASHLLGRCSTVWPMPPALSALVILKIGSHFLSKLTWTVILQSSYLYFPG
jgi:hypothetical protein